LLTGDSADPIVPLIPSGRYLTIPDYALIKRLNGSFARINRYLTAGFIGDLVVRRMIASGREMAKQNPEIPMRSANHA
jgi:hypothetical protein